MPYHRRGSEFTVQITTAGCYWFWLLFSPKYFVLMKSSPFLQENIVTRHFLANPNVFQQKIQAFWYAALLFQRCLVWVPFSSSSFHVTMARDGRCPLSGVPSAAHTRAAAGRCAREPDGSGQGVMYVLMLCYGGVVLVCWPGSVKSLELE